MLWFLVLTWHVVWVLFDFLEDSGITLWFGLWIGLITCGRLLVCCVFWCLFVVLFGGFAAGFVVVFLLDLRFCLVDVCALLCVCLFARFWVCICLIFWFLDCVVFDWWGFDLSFCGISVPGVEF